MSVSFFGVFMLFIFGTCGGFWYWTKYQVASTFSSVKEAADKERSKYRKVAADALRSYGYASVSSDTTFISFSSPQYLAGKCKGKGGRLHDFRIEVKHAEFDGEDTWEIIRILIDGQEV